MGFDMRWAPVMRNVSLTDRSSAAGAPERNLSGRIARMAAVAGTCAMVLFGLGIAGGYHTYTQMGASLATLLVDTDMTVNADILT